VGEATAEARLGEEDEFVWPDVGEPCGERIVPEIVGRLLIEKQFFVPFFEVLCFFVVIGVQPAAFADAREGVLAAAVVGEEYKKGAVGR
jgi:hypothetical protein